MVRIQDSQSWHRGSIPLSTTTEKPLVRMAKGFFDKAWRELPNVLKSRVCHKCRYL